MLGQLIHHPDEEVTYHLSVRSRERIFQLYHENVTCFLTYIAQLIVHREH